ncbi:MAG: hypothetical protein E7460_09170 [Ruminococcaceae bacterium]|nr:hypothetical protein [Oscillospiraceae bacterium]
MITLGIDTSNYTTSAALYEAEAGFLRNCGKLLSVESGQRGLRQSDAVFAHTKNLPAIFEELFADRGGCDISAVGVSYAPREVEGSYMPCFLSGIVAATAVASSRGIPLHRFSHQAGHVAAAAYSAERPELLNGEFYAWHLSGGTSELLLCTPHGENIVSCRRIGGSSDISAGQAVDRTGVKLGLGFPAGKELDRLALSYEDKLKGAALSVKGTEMSLSGLENKAEELIYKGAEKEYIAKFVFLTIARSVTQVTNNAIAAYGEKPILISGGVAGSAVLRQRFSQTFKPCFGTPALSADNAAGIAILTHIKENR